MAEWPVSLTEAQQWENVGIPFVVRKNNQSPVLLQRSDAAAFQPMAA